MVFESETDFELRFEYRNDLFKEETIRSFADSFLKIVEQFLKKSKLCEVELVNENQLAELDNFNKTEFPFDDRKPLLICLRSNAKKLPTKQRLYIKKRSSPTLKLMRLQTELHVMFTQRVSVKKRLFLF